MFLTPSLHHSSFCCSSQLMRQFFWALAAILSRRLEGVSKDSQALLHPGGSHSFTGGGAGSGTNALQAHAAEQLSQRTAVELLGLFGLRASSAYEAEKMLLGSCDCQISIESNSAVGATSGDARIFLFSRYLCIEQPIVLFTQRQAFRLSEILSLVHPKGFDAEGSGMATVDLQMKGRSVRVTMQAELMPEFEKMVEEARLIASDMSFLKKADAERQAGAEMSSISEASVLGVTPSVTPSGTPRSASATATATFASGPTAVTSIPAASRSNSGGRSGVRTIVDESAAIEQAKQMLISSFKGGKKAGHLMGGQRSDREWPMGAEEESGGGVSGGVHIKALSADEWQLLLQGATARAYQRNTRIVQRSRKLDGLLFITRGSLRAQVDMPGRPQALVVGHLGPGDIVGTNSFILGSLPMATVIVESDEALVVRLPARELFATFAEQPVIAGKFYCFLATVQAERLRIYNSQTSAELTITEDTNAPKTMAAITENNAFMIIINKFLKTLPDAGAEHIALLEFVKEVKALQQEGNPAQMRKHIQHIYTLYVAPDAARPINLPEMLQESISEAQANALSQNNPADGKSQGSERTIIAARAQELRHLFDAGYAHCIRVLETRILSKFLSSSHYDYVLQLLAKEQTTLTAEHFTVVRLLGEGAFGQVLEVVKRDCGKRYAMKVMAKDRCSQTFGEGWESICLEERKLMATLHHPLLINLAYAYQNLRFLVLVMDVCHGGDLDKFGVTGDLKFTSGQVTSRIPLPPRFPRSLRLARPLAALASSLAPPAPHSCLVEPTHSTYPNSLVAVAICRPRVHRHHRSPPAQKRYVPRPQATEPTARR